MNYLNIYNNLISKAQNRVLDGYSEKHHIVPRCIGGSDEPENLVRLSPEEHYLAHQLLVKIHPNSHALVRAAIMMRPSRPTNKLYGWLRRRFAEAQKIGQAGEANSQYGTKWVTNGERDKKIPRSQPPEEGWVEGRKSRAIKKREKKEKSNKKAKLAKDLKREKKEKLRKLHEVYIAEGFEGVLRTGYNKSKQNLVMQFAKHLPEFIPQNGKKRGLP